MSDTISRVAIGDPTDIRYPSLAALQAVHNDLLRRQRQDGQAPDFRDAAIDFLRAGSATGALLDADEDRRAAQSILDYWGARLFRLGQEPPDSTLADFNPLLAPEIPDALCPYLGLDAFREDDAEKFYGRRRLVAELVDRLASHRLIAVVGPSGSGKSSLVRAGLIPALKAGALPGSQEWNYLPPIVPGSEPLASLDRILAPDRNMRQNASSQEQDWGEIELGESRDRIPLQPTMLVVDQFEELWTLCDDEAARQIFIAKLMALAEAPDAGHCVILTMRSDFEAFVARAPTLQVLFDAGRSQVTPLSAAELREAIEQPADAVGLKFEAGVVDLLLQDILGEPAGLPLLQFTLLKLWEHRERNRVTRVAYEQTGGGRLALARSADAFYAGLIPEEQITARRILLRMVRPDEGLEITSSRVRRADLLRGGEDPGRVERVLARLVAARLVRLTIGEIPNDEQVEIAHEALVRNWPALVKWLEEEKVALATRRRLESRAAEWMRLGQRSGGLLDEVELREAERWLSSSEAAYLGYDPVLPGLVEASRAEIERVKQERINQQIGLATAKAIAETERQRAEEQAEGRRRLRIFTFVLFMLLVLALAATSVAIFQRGEARTQSNLARTAEAKARADADARATAQIQAQHDATLARTAEAKAQIAEAGAQREARNAQEARQQEAIARAAVELHAHAGEALFALNQGEVDHALLLARASVPSGTQADLPLFSYARRRTFESTVRSLPLIGHKNWVIAAAWRPDGRQVLTSSDDKTARIWDATTGQLVRTLSGHTGEVHAGAWSPDGRLILTGSTDKTARIWDATTGQLVRTLSGHTDEVRAVAWSPDGRLILTGSADRTARIWDAATGSPIRTLAGHTGEVLAVAWRYDGQQILTGSTDQTARIWNATTGQPLQTLAGHTTWVFAVAWRPDGRYLLTGSGDGTARIWNAGTGRSERTLTGHGGDVRAVAWSPDGQQVLTGSADQTARIWNATTGQPMQALAGHTGIVWATAWSPDGQQVLTGSADQTARIWMVAKGEPVRILTSPIGKIWTAAWSPDGRQIFTGGDDQIGHLWDAATGKAIRDFNGHIGIVWAASWNPNGQQIVTGSSDKTIRLWDATTGNLVWKRDIGAEEVRAVAWSPGGGQILTGNSDGTARLWESATGSPIRTFTTPTTEISAVAWSRDGKNIAAGSNDGTARLWEVATGNLILTISGQASGISVVAWDPDGRKILTGANDTVARVWDVATGKLVLNLIGHTGGILAVTWSPDGRQILTGSVDRTARIWDAATGSLEQTLEGHTGDIRAAAWSPDGQEILTGSFDGTARLWIANNKLITAELTRRICTLFRGREEEVHKQISSWRGCGAELAAVDRELKIYDDLRGGK